jgi:hypothetical protein
MVPIVHRGSNSSPTLRRMYWQPSEPVRENLLSSLHNTLLQSLAVQCACCLAHCIRCRRFFSDTNGFLRAMRTWSPAALRRCQTVIGCSWMPQERGRCPQQSASGWVRTCGRCAYPVGRLSLVLDLAPRDMRDCQCPSDVSALVGRKFSSNPADLRSCAGSDPDGTESGVDQGSRMRGIELFP